MKYSVPEKKIHTSPYLSPPSRLVLRINSLKERYQAASEIESGNQAIILSVHDEQTALDECLSAGARGFVLKRTASTDLLAAVQAVLKGGNYISPSGCTQTEKPERNKG